MGPGRAPGRRWWRGLSGPPPVARAPPVLTWAAAAQPPTAGEGRMRHFCRHRQRSGVDGKALHQGCTAAPQGAPARLRLPAGPGWARAAAEPLPQPPGPPAAPQHGGAGGRAGGAAQGGSAAAAAGAAAHGGCSPPAPPRQPDTAPRAASLHASVCAGWRCRRRILGTPQRWRLVVMARVMVPCPVPWAARGAEHSGDPRRVLGSPGTGELLGSRVPSLPLLRSPGGCPGRGTERGHRGRAHMLSASW